MRVCVCPVCAMLALGAVKIFFLLGALLVSAVHEIAVNARVAEVPIIFSDSHVQIIPRPCVKRCRDRDIRNCKLTFARS